LPEGRTQKHSFTYTSDHEHAPDRHRLGLLPSWLLVAGAFEIFSQGDREIGRYASENFGFALPLARPMAQTSRFRVSMRAEGAANNKISHASRSPDLPVKSRPHHDASPTTARRRSSARRSLELA
jgi:hypothetical protein